MDPGRYPIAITPHDTTEVNARGLYVGTGGDLAIVSMDGTTSITFANVPSGTILPVFAFRVKSTGTTAADIVAFDAA
ncbi:hypothetical protein B7G68_15190 [Caulobacter segnis]|uniref:Uncharacterized protein n=1 Tax=Caulobacter segnis TaxID=88688 RepID=A0ABM6TML6_9CAUL|nr:hypothetical protein B7G68_15190 [Caulobacter segnis]